MALIKHNNLKSAVHKYLWIIVAVLIFIILTVIYTIYDYNQSRQNIVSLLRDRGILITNLIVRTGSVALDVNEEQMIAELREIKEMDRQSFFSLREISRYNQTPTPYHIIVVDSQFNPQIPLPPPLQQYPQFRAVLKRLVHSFQRSTDEFHFIQMPGVHRRHKMVHDALISRRTDKNGYLILVHRPRPRRNRLGAFNLQDLVDRLVADLSIHYIAFVINSRVIALGGQVDTSMVMDRLSSGIQSTISEKDGQKIFEYMQALPARPPSQNQVFVGLPATELEQLDSRLKRRIIFSSLLFIFVGAISIVLILNRQRYQLISSRYSEMQTYTSNILYHMQEGIIAVDKSSEIILFNRVAREIFHFDAAETISLSDLGLKSKQLLNIIKDREQISYEELLINQRILAVSTSTIPESEKSSSNFIILIQDITDLKSLQEQVVRQDKLKAMGKLASRVAHEIRNPLNAIGLNIQRLQREFSPKKETAEYKQITTTVHEEVRRLNKIIETFLQFARPPQLKRQYDDLLFLIKDLETLLRPMLDEKNIKFNVDVPQSVRLFYDYNQLKQALLNLIQNAVDACKENDTITIRVIYHLHEVCIYIEDTGTGILPEEQSRVFDLYYTNKETGTGLGLSLASKIIIAHDGQVQVESPYFTAQGSEVRGSRFIILLPLRLTDEN